MALSNSHLCLPQGVVVSLVCSGEYKILNKVSCCESVICLNYIILAEQRSEFVTGNLRMFSLDYMVPL